MGAVSLTGSDVIKIRDRIFSDVADGDTAMISFPNDLMAGKTGKNGTTIIAFNSTGQNAEVTLRVILGSADDKFLNSEYQSFRRDPAAYIPMPAEFVKRSGDGQGNVTDIVYSMETGIPRKIPDVKENVEGDTEQSVAVWQINFYNGDRAV